MTKEQPQKTSAGLVLAPLPDRIELRQLVASLEKRRDAIADQDLKIETLRQELADFEALYQSKLANQQSAFERVETTVKHLERWADLLEHNTTPQVPTYAERLNHRRQEELHHQKQWRQHLTPPDPKASENEADASTNIKSSVPSAKNDVANPRQQRLKDAYRALARRFHPDLARTEQESVSFGEKMGRINELYRLKDVDRLETMTEQAKGGQVDDLNLSTDEKITHLKTRLKWFDIVHANLLHECDQLEETPIHLLWQEFKNDKEQGQDIFIKLAKQLHDDTEAAYKTIIEAIFLVEDSVRKYNRRVTKKALSTKKTKAALTQRFDVLANHPWAKLGLEHLSKTPLTLAQKEKLRWLTDLIHEQKSQLRLLLLTYICELSPFPLEGLESFNDIAQRFDHLNKQDRDAQNLTQSLVLLDDTIEYGIKVATSEVAHVGLRFRDRDMLAAIPEALKTLAIRRIYKDVLAILGRQADCQKCKHKVYPLPLFRLRGLDHLRSSVCPLCGHTLNSYWMPKGKDIQSILNTKFLDFELISEWRFHLGRGQVALQLVPYQVEHLTMGDLRKRLTADLFERYNIEVSRKHLSIVQNERKILSKTPLLSLVSQVFDIRLVGDSGYGEQELLDLVRHRIRTRFN
jgi:hypothetical protein